MNLLSIYKKTVTICLFLLTLIGCSTLPESQTSVEWQSHRQKLTSISQYQANGKLGYIAPDQRQSLNFNWRHSADENQLTLRTFLGQTVLTLDASSKGAQVTTMEGEVFRGHNAQQLIARLTGLSIPADSLSHWLIGLPDSADYYELNQENTLASLDKLIEGKNWRLTYSGYSDVMLDNESIPLPSRMTLTDGTTKLNIVISKWVITR